MRRAVDRFPRPVIRDPREDPGSGAAILSTATAVAIGLLILLDFLTTNRLLDTIGALLLEYGLIIAAFALLLGVLNLLSVHWKKVEQHAEGWRYSLLLLGITLFLIVVGLRTGPEGSLVEWTFVNVLFPLQSAFFSLLAFFLLAIAYRLLRVNSVESLLFVASAVLVILGATPLGADITSFLPDARAYLLAVPVAAGTRGLLLGIALGTIVTGLRLISDGRRYFK